MELVNNTNKETTTTTQNARTYGKKNQSSLHSSFLIKKKRPKCVCLRKYRDLIECVPNVDKRNKHNFLARQHNRDVFFCSANFSVSFNQHKSEWEKLHLLVKQNVAFVVVVVVTVLSFDGRLIPPFLSHNSISFVKKFPSLNHKSFRAEFKLLS